MQPLDPEVHYGITDRTYLDRNPVQMELLPEKLRELRWKLNQKAKKEPKFRFYALYDRVYRMDVLEAAWKQVGKRKKAAGIDGVRAEDILDKERGEEEFPNPRGAQSPDLPCEPGSKSLYPENRRNEETAWNPPAERPRGADGGGVDTGADL